MGTPRRTDGQFLHPHVPAVDSEGNVYVSDRDLANVQKFTGNGKFIMKWDEQVQMTVMLSKPESVPLIQRIIFMWLILEIHRIHKFTKDGKFISMWDSKGVGEGEFNGPAGCQLIKMTHICHGQEQ